MVDDGLGKIRLAGFLQRAFQIGHSLRHVAGFHRVQRIVGLFRELLSDSDSSAPCHDPLIGRILLRGHHVLLTGLVVVAEVLIDAPQRPMRVGQIGIFLDRFTNSAWAP